MIDQMKALNALYKDLKIILQCSEIQCFFRFDCSFLCPYVCVRPLPDTARVPIHKRLEMQNYLKPNRSKIKIEEAQEIFKMRSRVSDVKSNFKGKDENFTCNICENEDETQKHIIDCPLINKERKDYEKPPEYEELYQRNIQNQLKIVKHFLENMKIKKKLKS